MVKMQLDQVRKVLAPTGRLRAAINMSNFLLVSAADAHGKPEGLSPSLAGHIATLLDVELELIAFASPGEVADAARTNSWDIANIAHEAERAETIAFSQPYIQIDANFLIRKNGTISSNEDVNDKNIEIILYGRSAYDLWLKENYLAPKFNRTSSIQRSHEMFHQGQGDVLASLKPRLLEDVKAYSNCEILMPAFTSIKQAVGVQKENESVLPFLNQMIKSALQTGMIESLCKKFGVADKLSLPE